MRSNTKLRPAGTLTILGASGETTESDLLQCVHCGGHFTLNPGSGKTRGFCMNCNGPVCGKSCEKCVPIEQWLENREAGVADDHKPVRVSMGGILLP